MCLEKEETQADESEAVTEKDQGSAGWGMGVISGTREAEPTVRLWAVMSAAVPMRGGPPRPVLGGATARSGRPGGRGACMQGGWK